MTHFFPTLLLLLPILVKSMNYHQCLNICGGPNGGRCHTDSTSSYDRDYQCICDNGIDGRNCAICAPGFFGKNCAFQCPLGFWGQNCTKSCNCSSPGSIFKIGCFPANGNCMCKDGYLRSPLASNGSVPPIWEEGTGQDCTFRCEPGKWGRDCQNTCDCQNDVNCHHVSGRCLCPPDEWTGTKCEKPCVKGTAKPGCKFSCECIEGQGICDESTGNCACFSGFMGPRCEWPCPNGFWGPGCQERCPKCRWCNPVNGTCEFVPQTIVDRFAHLAPNEDDKEVATFSKEESGNVTNKMVANNSSENHLGVLLSVK